MTLAPAPPNVEQAMKDTLGNLLFQNIVLNTQLQHLTSERDALKAALAALTPATETQP